MHVLDWAVLSAYFLVMVGIGWWAKARVHNAADFFTAGGKMPWWLSGISHHMSGYSAAVFVAYAAIAYTTGFALYVWWAVGITIACAIGAVLFAPRWPRLRQRLGIISPLEYLAIRYNVPTQQVLAWSGAALKVFDVAAKWAASAILLQVFAGVPLAFGIFIVGGVTVTMFVFAATKIGTVFGIWDQLPPSHAQPFAGTFTLPFFLGYAIISTISYNGGTWNLAQRFIASPTGSAARKSIILSGALYLLWPLILFFPMWAAPIILPGLAKPDQSYALLATSLLPVGLVGLVLAGMFSHTMAMTSSDAKGPARLPRRAAGRPDLDVPVHRALDGDRAHRGLVRGGPRPHHHLVWRARRAHCHPDAVRYAAGLQEIGAGCRPDLVGARAGRLRLHQVRDPRPARRSRPWHDPTSDELVDSLSEDQPERADRVPSYQPESV